MKVLVKFFYAVIYLNGIKGIIPKMSFKSIVIYFSNWKFKYRNIQSLDFFKQPATKISNVVDNVFVGNMCVYCNDFCYKSLFRNFYCKKMLQWQLYVATAVGVGQKCFKWICGVNQSIHGHLG